MRKINPNEKWRLIVDPPASGQWNMAVDAALLETAETGSQNPALRFYQWDRPTLSLGRNQRAEGIVDFEYLERRGFGLVRRPTGGRAILHDNEVTYSVTVPEGSHVFGSLKEVYSRISGAITSALAELGVETHSGGVGNYEKSASCFAARTRYEISVNGRKVAGSAQRRLKRSALQHGSIILSADADAAGKCLVWQDARSKAEAARMMGGLGLDADEVRDAMVIAFERLFGIEFYESRLEDGEKARARDLAAELAQTAGAV